MKQKLRLIAAVLGILFTVTACASLRYNQKQEDILGIVELVNSGQEELLADLCQIPFLFDGEILMMRGDAGIVWRNLISAGFQLSQAEVSGIEKTGEESYLQFGDTMDVRTFFAKYVPPTARLALVKSADFSLTLILNDKDEESGYPRILGIRVEPI
jgi:hypothetical protein